MRRGGYRKTADLPHVIPVFPLAGALLFPRATLPLNIFEPRYLNMIDDALSGERLIGMIQPAHGDPANPPLMDVGALGRITAFAELDDGRYLITLTGVSRFRVEQELSAATPYRQVIAGYDEFADDLAGAGGGLGLDRDRLTATLREYAAMHGFNVDWSTVEQAPPETLVNVASMLCPLDIAAKQALLEATTLLDRADTLIALLEMECAARGGPESPLQ